MLNRVANEFTFSSRVWRYDGSAPWHFVTLPRSLSKQIKDDTGGMSKAFGSVKVAATLGNTRWKTSIFPDTKMAAYLLPIKASVRQREQIQAGMLVEVFLVVSDSVR